VFRIVVLLYFKNPPSSSN